MKGVFIASHLSKSLDGLVLHLTQNGFSDLQILQVKGYKSSCHPMDALSYPGK